MAFNAAEFVPSGASEAVYSPEPPDTEGVDGVSGWLELRCFGSGQPGASPDAVRCIALHPTRELIYTGTVSGALHVHEAESAERIACSRPDGDIALARGQDPAVRGILAAGTVGGPDAVVVACASGVRVLTRGCAPYATFKGDGMADSIALARNPASTAQLAVGGGSSVLSVVDWSAAKIMCQGSLRGGNRVTCAEWSDVAGAGSLAMFATRTGSISVHDPSSMRQVSTVAAYAGPVTSMSVRGTTLAACGMSMRGGITFIDQAVKLFDIRALHQPLASVPFPEGPVCVSFDTWVSTAITGGDALWALSATGALQCVEIGGLQDGQGIIPVSNEMQLDANNDSFTALAVSPEGLVICGDSGGFLHQWSASELARLNASSEPVWESDQRAPAILPPRPSFNAHYFLRNICGATIPMSVLPMERGLVSTDFIDGVARKSVANMYGDLGLGFVEDEDATGSTWKDAGRGASRGRGRGSYNPGMKRVRTRRVDPLGCGRAPFSRFPPKVSESVLKMASWEEFVACAQAPPNFVRNSKTGHEEAPFPLKNTSGEALTPSSARSLRSPPSSQPARHGVVGSPGSSSKNAIRRNASVDELSPEFLLSDSVNGKVDYLLNTPYGRSSYVEMDLVAWESVEGFDFLRYNQSGMFCGLENALPNVYVNPAVQALYFTPPFRNALSYHTCEQDVCISCELGFLFTMLDVGRAGVAVEAGNFTKSFMTMANAGALGLLDGSTSLPLASRIESFTSYLLEQLHKDAGGQDTDVSRLMGADAVSSGEFYPSRKKWERTSRQFQHSLMYDGSPKDFAQLVQMSLHRECPRTRAFCSETGVYEAMSHSRRLASLPNLLLLGANSKGKGFESWWLGSKSADRSSSEGPRSQSDVGRLAEEAMRKRPKLVAGLRLSIDRSTGKLDVSEAVVRSETVADGAETSDVQNPAQVFSTPYDRERIQSGDTGGPLATSGDLEAEYELSFVIARVYPLASTSQRQDSGHYGSSTTDGHLIVYVRVPSSYRGAKPGGGTSSKLKSPSEWWCLNDFVIAPCDKGWVEVASFAEGWKSPCLFGFVRRDVNARIPRITRAPPANLRELIAPGRCNAATGISADEEVPGRGSLVGLDCEFVMTEREDCDITGDGKRTVVTPARMALARVSVVRGSGELIGLPLIDDYVEVKEPVVDYLTRWSGISPGDLDPGRSSYTVRQLKTVYKKLLALVDAGVKFVGHGLKKDLRVLNFAVPADQVVDTVVLFREPNRRLLSLRFLVGTLLHEEIQASGTFGHDSVEDAVAALRLHSAYEQLVERDCFNDTLKALYTYGYKHDWKASAEDPFVIGG